MNSSIPMLVSSSSSSGSSSSSSESNKESTPLATNGTLALGETFASMDFLGFEDAKRMMNARLLSFTCLVPGEMNATMDSNSAAVATLMKSESSSSMLAGNSQVAMTPATSVDGAGSSNLASIYSAGDILGIDNKEPTTTTTTQTKSGQEDIDLIDLELLNFVAFCDDECLSDCGGSPTPANSDAEDGAGPIASSRVQNLGPSIPTVKPDEDTKSVDTDDEHDGLGGIFSLADIPKAHEQQTKVESSLERIPRPIGTEVKTLPLAMAGPALAFANAKKHRLSDADKPEDPSYEGDDERRKFNTASPYATRKNSVLSLAQKRKKTGASLSSPRVGRQQKPTTKRDSPFSNASSPSSSSKLESESSPLTFVSIGFLNSQQQAKPQPRSAFQCQAPGCEKSYLTAEGLRLHVRNHHEIDKRWVCLSQGCERKFVRQSDLRMHIVRMHSGVRPFPCTEVGCGKAFACNSELRRHITMSHKDKRDVLLEEAQAHVKNGSETVATILKDLACMKNTSKR